MCFDVAGKGSAQEQRFKLLCNTPPLQVEQLQREKAVVVAQAKKEGKAVEEVRGSPPLSPHRMFYTAVEGKGTWRAGGTQHLFTPPTPPTPPT